MQALIFNDLVSGEGREIIWEGEDKSFNIILFLIPEMHHILSHAQYKEPYALAFFQIKAALQPPKPEAVFNT